MSTSAATVGPSAAEDLLIAVRNTVPDVAGVVAARRLPAGASRETWVLDQADGEALVLRLNTPGALEADALLREGGLMRAAAAAGVPSPEVLADGLGSGALARGFVLMRHVAGESVPARILRSPELAGLRSGFAAECGAILARLHTMDASTVRPALSDEDQLDAWAATLAQDPDPHPILEHVAGWLRRHRPAPVTPVPVHGDFRLGNMLVGPEGVRAVLDWELAHLGDPAEDLGWLSIRAWRFGQQAEVAGCGTLEELIAGYRGAGGATIDPERVRWWQVLGCFRWGVICLHQVGRHLSGAERSVELAAIGRRVAEAEYDAMLLIG